MKGMSFIAYRATVVPDDLSLTQLSLRFKLETK